MSQIQFTALPTDIVRAYQNGTADANNQLPEQHVSTGSGTPCRHCLQPIAAGEPYLVLAHRPFPAPQPYAEVGPIFIHADACVRYGDELEVEGETAVIPPILDSKQYIVRGYNEQDRIIYGTGQVIKTADILQYSAQLLAQNDVAYLHIRSAANNCFQCRIDVI
ncbi:MAG: DUF1203 domain-containing protein [Chloroflexota bacterium]